MIGESIKKFSSLGTTLTEKELESLEEAAFYESGLIAHGCLENLDDYARESIKRYGRWLLKWVKEEEKDKETPSAQRDLIAYTDGSGSEEACGFGVVFLYEDEEGYHKVYEECGNLSKHASRQIAGEIEAAIVAIKYALDNKSFSLKIVHDYTGIGRWTSGAWRAKDPDAQRLVEWHDYAVDCGLDISYTWVKGHSKDKWNEYADELATKGVAQTNIRPKTPRPFLVE